MRVSGEEEEVESPQTGGRAAVGGDDEGPAPASQLREVLLESGYMQYITLYDFHFQLNNLLKVILYTIIAPLNKLDYRPSAAVISSAHSPRRMPLSGRRSLPQLLEMALWKRRRRRRRKR